MRRQPSLGAIVASRTSRAPRLWRRNLYDFMMLQSAAKKLKYAFGGLLVLVGILFVGLGLYFYFKDHAKIIPTCSALWFMGVVFVLAGGKYAYAASNAA